MSRSDYLVGGIDFSDITILDAGTGAGGATLLLARKVEEAGGKGRIISVDKDPEAFLEAKRNLREYVRFLEFVEADLTHMPQIESGVFDLVVCTGTLCALNDRPLKALKGLTEFDRVLKESGRLVIAEEFPLRKAKSAEQEVQVMRWQTYKAVAELTGEGHYTEIYPEELEFAASLVGFKNIEWRMFERGPLHQDTMKEWREVMRQMATQIRDELTREAFLALISRIHKKYRKEGGKEAPGYVMKMRK
jgi:SAM-dependent methyltransferase